jgi:type I restriction-modification system DNA methylase subunit
MSIPAQICDLVERFDKHLADYKTSKYNETQVRREFIDPFFKALEWDVDNTQGYAEAYKDVVHEDAIKVGQATKAPDYSFRIGGARKFFLEAKKPSVDIKHDTHPAYQLRRYGWSAKLPLSILTDFEEFAVYDCRVKPVKTDNAATARIMYLTYTDYIERWDELQGIFSPESIKTGSFDKYAQTTKAKRGTAEVDNAFLQEIERWRDLLARNFALRNNLTQRELNYAVQLTIDRLIFLRIAEDRSIEPYGQLKDLLKADNIYPNLVQLFARADDRYNSGLFHFKAEKSRATEVDSLTPNLTLDNKVLTDVFKNLYYPDSPYEFSVLPADILGQVYEQFLGKVIRLTSGGRAKVEEKPEVKKAGGVYYTPTYIVDYIVKQTVGKLFEGQQLGAKGYGLVGGFRILDPACGSGSFLLGAYQYLLDWYLEQYRQSPNKWSRGQNPRLYERGNGEWQLTIAERKRILTTHIYGVDIDPQAVEVTKLSLLLKVLEDDKSVTQQLTLFQERVLPDLDSNIKCGNSLIGPDYYASNPTQMGMFGDEEEFYRVNAFDWQAEFKEIMQAGGFDAVIGNPPYGALLYQDETDYLLNKTVLQNYQLDTYLIFIEKALFLVKQRGLIGQIIPNTWLSNLTSVQVRKYLFMETQLNNITHYLYHVFKTAKVDTEVVILSKQKPLDEHQINISVVHKDSNTDVYNIPQKYWQEGDGTPVNIFERPEFKGIGDKLRNEKRLDELCKITQGCKPFQTGKGKPPQTRQIVNDKPFIAEICKDDTFRPLLRGSLMQKYQILWKDNYWISFGDWLAEPRYSANYDFPAKIIIRQTGYYLVATLDRKQFIVRDNLYTIVPYNEKYPSLDSRYILGIINSCLMQWFYSNIINPEMGEAFAQVKRGHLIQLRIYWPDFTNPADVAQHDKMVAMVEQMLTLHQQLAGATIPQQKQMLKRQIETTDRQIDMLVYELYGLTDEEIAIVEGSTS